MPLRFTICCGILTVVLLGLGACATSQKSPEAACAAHHVARGTPAFAECVALVREEGPSILRHGHTGGHQ